MVKNLTSTELAHESFDDWMSRSCTPPSNYTFAQYARYIEGWRNSKPWAHQGMSIAYDQWAESRWDQVRSQSELRQAWKWGLALKVKSVVTAEPTWCRHASAEECADFALTLPATIEQLAAESVGVLVDQRSDLFS